MASIEKNLPTSRYEQLKKLPLKKLGAGLFAASAMLSACSSAPDTSSEDTGVDAGEIYTPENPPVSQEGAMSEAERQQLEWEEVTKPRIEKYAEFTFEALDYSHIVAGEEISGADALSQYVEMSVDEYPADTPEGREALARVFMNNLRDVYINGGLTRAEATGLVSTVMKPC